MQYFSLLYISTWMSSYYSTELACGSKSGLLCLGKPSIGAQSRFNKLWPISPSMVQAHWGLPWSSQKIKSDLCPCSFAANIGPSFVQSFIRRSCIILKSFIYCNSHHVLPRDASRRKW